MAGTSVRVQVERLPSPPITYWPMVMGPWDKGGTGNPIYVVIWLWFYVTLWAST